MSERGAGARDELGDQLELAALVGLAFVQPVLGPFGEAPGTFIAAGADAGDVVRFGLAVVLVPLVAVGLLAVASRLLGGRVRAWVQTVLVGVLAGLAAVALTRDAGDGLETAGRVAVAVAAGGVVALLHARFEAARSFLRFLSPLPLVLLAVFLFASPVAELVQAGGGGDVDRTDGEHPSVVMIVLDELPTLTLSAAGAVDAELYPNLARFAATSTWYRNSTSVAGQTAVAVPALATGTFPTDTAAPATVETHPDSIFSLLAPTHRVHAVEWVTDLCGPSICDDEEVSLDAETRRLAPNLVGEADAPLPTLLDEARSLWWGQAWPGAEPELPAFVEPAASEADDLVRPALQFLSGLVDAGDGRPVLDYVHVPLPHQPWFLLPDGEHHQGPWPARGLEFTAWPEGETGERLAAQGRVHHVLQLQWVDRWLGTVIDRLQRLDRWDDSIVVVAADHGFSFTPTQSGRELSADNQAEIAWAPLLIKAPGQVEPVVDDGNALTIDVVPTIAELARVELPYDTDGESLAGGDRRADDDKPFLARLDTGLEPAPDAPEAVNGEVIALDADGLAAILGTPAAPPPGDALRAWRHGEFGAAIGRTVDELVACSDEGPAFDHDEPDGWEAYVEDGGVAPGEPLPLWHEGLVGASEQLGVAAVVDGVVAGWGPSTPNPDNNPVGLLLAEPVLAAAEHPERLDFYELLRTPGPGGCTLRRLA